MSSGEGSASGEKERRPRLRALSIGLGGAFALIVGVLAFLYLGAPGLVRSEILKAVAERYHRTARLDRVRLDPLRLRAEFDGFSLPDRDGRPMIGFRRLSAGLSWPSLLIGKIDFDDLALDAPDVRVVRRRDGRLNLADLVPSGPDKAEGKDKPLALRIAHFRLTDGRAVLVDAMRPTPFERRFEKITFSVKDFATTSDGASYALAASTGAGERLSWRGSIGMAPLASKGRFVFANWRAERLAAIAPDALPFAVTSGELEVSGAYDVALKGADLSLRLDIDQAMLRSAAIRPKGGDVDPVRADALALSGVHVDVAKRDVRIAHVVLTGPDVTGWRAKSGEINLAAFAPPPAPEAQGPEWTVSAPDIRVEKGRVSFEDRAAGEAAAWDATPIDLTVTGFAYPIAAPVQILAHMQVDDGSSLEAKGSLSLPTAPGKMVGGALDLALDGLDVTRFQPYVSEAAKVRLTDGDVSARGRVDLDPDGGVRFVGALAVDELRAVDPALKSDLVTWDRVEATGVAASSKPFSVKIARILAKGAYGRVVLEPNYDINIRAVLEQSDTPPAGVAALTLKPAKAQKPLPAKVAPPIDLPIDIGRIDVVNGRMDFTDLTVQPRFSAGIQSLNGSITGLSARAGSRAKVDLKGGVDAFSPVAIAGALDPFAADRYLDMRMQFHNMELTTFSPYSGKFAGYRIDKGKLDVDLRYQIQNEHLDASHHVVINELQLGDKVDSADAVKLPVKLIVALLKDKNGVIDLPIDVSGSLDDPKFKLWPVIWKIVGNLFDKVVSAPFTMLGHLVGHGGGEELSKIQFEPGSAAISPQQSEKLAALAKALDLRPALELEIPTVASPDLDRPALTEADYRRTLQDAVPAAFKGKGAPDLAGALAAPKLKRRLLETAYRRTLGQKPPPFRRAPGDKTDPDLAAANALEAALRAHVSASDSALQKLAQKRAEAVEAAIVQAGHVDPKRLFLVTAKPLAGGPIEMNLSLK